LPEAGPLLAEVKGDNLKAVYDDAVEVFVDPTLDAPDHVGYPFRPILSARAGTTSTRPVARRKRRIGLADGGRLTGFTMAGGTSMAPFRWAA
jgi:hypothetical protein